MYYFRIAFALLVVCTSTAFGAPSADNTVAPVTPTNPSLRSAAFSVNENQAQEQRQLARKLIKKPRFNPPKPDPPKPDPPKPDPPKPDPPKPDPPKPDPPTPSNNSDDSSSGDGSSDDGDDSADSEAALGGTLAAIAAVSIVAVTVYCCCCRSKSSDDAPKEVVEPIKMVPTATMVHDETTTVTDTEVPSQDYPNAALSTPTKQVTVICDVCQTQGTRASHYKCATCVDFDLCAACRAAGNHGHHSFLSYATPPTATSMPTIIATGPKMVVRVYCDVCQAVGTRTSHYKCSQCPEFDICQSCHIAGHHGHHSFVQFP